MMGRDYTVRCRTLCILQVQFWLFQVPFICAMQASVGVSVAMPNKSGIGWGERSDAQQKSAAAPGGRVALLWLLLGFTSFTAKLCAPAYAR
jgi:hypothetical protein